MPMFSTFSMSILPLSGYARFLYMVDVVEKKRRERGNAKLKSKEVGKDSWERRIMTSRLFLIP
uniref:Uncharacterized protein n=1 Tax=Candidatus Kentrum sp. LFY TaxID=2126342 RepID=A0A450U916_9GAMM|nr:MAG: hypothetical protein BECKLFY1418A_GA0070994_100450 [Candidatus Kentron sp. LFY]